ncbi:MAG: DUF2334 domain-containing protein [Gemmatimonadota bacterium]
MSATTGPASEVPWYIPELHDVSERPGCNPAPMLELLPRRAREVAALLVVPDWAGQHPLKSGSSLVRELSELPGEKVLHGFRHLRRASLTHRIFCGTEDEAEFARCREDDARYRLAMGIRLFRDALAEAPRWFCAPRWSESTETRYVLRELPLRGHMHRSGYTLRSASSGAPVRISIDALWFDDGARWPPRLIGAARRVVRLIELLRERRPFRLVLHPRDVAYPATCRAITRLVERLSADGWEPRGLPPLAI